MGSDTYWSFCVSVFCRVSNEKCLLTVLLSGICLTPGTLAKSFDDLIHASRGETIFIFKNNIRMKLCIIYLFMQLCSLHLCVVPFINIYHNLSSCLFRSFIHLLNGLSIHLFIYLRIYLCMYLGMCLCMHACTHVCMHACMFVCLYVY